MQLTQVATRWSRVRGSATRFQDVFPREEAIAAIAAAAERERVAQETGISLGFVTAMQALEAFATQAVVQETRTKQLWYHTLDHARTVKRRAQLIFEQVEPYWGQASRQGAASPLDAIAPERALYLLGASAMAHDMVQEFLPYAAPHGPRRREIGTSESATIERLLHYIAQGLVSQPGLALSAAAGPTEPSLLPQDCQILAQAIEATICCYHAETGAFYQPLLYDAHLPLSLVARMVALADLGGLGIDGPEVYIQEGRQVFLEENLDVLGILGAPGALDAALSPIPDGVSRDWLWENLRQRLLRQARLQVQFARERLNRCDRELQGLPLGAIPAVRQRVFGYLNATTLQHLEAITPVAEETSLDVLLVFFGLDCW